MEDSTELNIFKLKEFGLLTGYAATTLRWKWSLSGRKSSIGICVDTEELYAKVNYTVTDRNTGKKTGLRSAGRVISTGYEKSLKYLDIYANFLAIWACIVSSGYAQID